MVEQRTFNPKALGSNPRGDTLQKLYPGKIIKEDYIEELGFKIIANPGPDHTEWKHKRGMSLIYSEKSDIWYFHWNYGKTRINSTSHLDNVMRILNM